MAGSTLSGTTWKISTNWTSAPQPDVYTATFNADGSLTITESSFAARNDANANGYWTSNGQMVSFCVAVSQSASGAPNAVGGYGGVFSTNTLSGYASGYMDMGGPAPQPVPGTWSATRLNRK